MSAEQQAPSVVFHVNVTDVLDYTVRLLRKAYQLPLQLQVLMGEFDPQRLSAALWALPDANFLVHAIHTDDGFVRDRKRVRLWLDPRSDVQVVCPVLINLGDSEVPSAHTLTKVIEIVGAGEHRLQAARRRWRAYVARGWEPQKHEASSRGS